MDIFVVRQTGFYLSKYLHLDLWGKNEAFWYIGKFEYVQVVGSLTGSYFW